MEPVSKDELDLVTVFESAGTATEMEAMAVKGLLEASGIQAVVERGASMPNLPEQVRVARADVDDAKRAIAAALAAGPAGALEAEKHTETQPQD